MTLFENIQFSLFVNLQHTICFSRIINSCSEIRLSAVEILQRHIVLTLLNYVPIVNDRNEEM